MESNNTPLVSICCMTYNHEPYIRQCIEGFLIQKTSFSFEIIIHDDASSDKTADIVREYSMKYPTIIHPILQVENQFSKGVKIFQTYVQHRIKGKYIAFCEGDDYWIDPQKLELQKDYLEANPMIGLVYTNVNCLHQETGLLEKDFFSSKKSYIKNTFEDFIINGWFIAPCTWMFRKDFYLQILPLLRKSYIVGDFPLLICLSKMAGVSYIDRVTAIYRILKNSASHFNEIEKKYQFEKGLYKIQMDYATLFDCSHETIDKIKEHYFHSIFVSACLANEKELKNEAYLFLKNAKRLSLKNKLVFGLSKISIVRFLLKYYKRKRN